MCFVHRDPAMNVTGQLRPPTSPGGCSVQRRHQPIGLGMTPQQPKSIQIWVFLRRMREFIDEAFLKEAVLAVMHAPPGPYGHRNSARGMIDTVIGDVIGHILQETLLNMLVNAGQ